MTDEVLQDRADRPVLRRGSTVLHPVQPWTPAVHALLHHLERTGFPYAPRVVGIDGDHDVLTYIEGESGPDGWAKVVDERGLVAAARLLRAYHDAVAGWRPDPVPTWFDGTTGTGGPDDIVCHGDFGPWNIVWRGVEPVGLLDWEYAHPAPPGYDVAYALEYLAPFRDDDECRRWLRYPEPPDRRRRIAVFAEAYGLHSTDGLVDAVIDVQREVLARVERLAAEGHARQVALLAAGDRERVRKLIAWSEAHRPLFT